MTQTEVYQILKELGGKDVPVQDIFARMKERYPGYNAQDKVGVKLLRLYKWKVVSRRFRGGRCGGYSYTIIGEYP